MRRIFLLIFLFVIITCVPGDFNDRYKKQMQIVKETMTKCILDTAATSEVLRNALNQNNDTNIKTMLYSIKDQLNEQDLSIISTCRKQATKVIREKLGTFS